MTDRLGARGDEVWGVDRFEPDGGFAGHRLLIADLGDHEETRGALDTADADVIVHLAAQASVRQSFDEPRETFLNNTQPVLSILDWMREHGGRRRLLAVGSADEYGVVEDPEALPLRETSPVAPVSPYALAKVVQGELCRQYGALYNVDVVLTRSFNHTGAGQRDAFVLPSFARQIVEIKLGRREPVIEVGNLDVRRDFLDVRDVCDAYIALIENGLRGETYNVCSGRAYHLRTVLERMAALAGTEVEIRVEPARLRPVDTPELRGDPAKIRRDTGWEPAIDIDGMLESLLADWEQRLGG